MLAIGGVQTVAANPAIVIDAASGEVLIAQDATASWYPASLTKLMTVYVALKAVRERRITLATPMQVSPRAARMPPSKMGFKPGQVVTLDNALKMLMVKSANDVAVTIAEGVSGSVESFAQDMNAHARALGMRESRFVNPNGLPATGQVTSARDMALLGRALYQHFPDHADLFGIGALSLGGKIIPTHNGLLGRYAGADGMKTGFTCSAGFNLVASATRGGRKLIAAVLGAPSAPMRTVQAASLLDKAFGGQASSFGAVETLASPGVGPAPDQRDAVCRNRGASVAAFSAEIEDFSQPIITGASGFFSPEGGAFLGAGAALAPSAARQVAAMPRPVFEPVPVYAGPAPGWAGPIARATAGPVSAYAAQSQADSPLKPDPRANDLRSRGEKARSAAAKAEPLPLLDAEDPKPTRASAKTAKRPDSRAAMAHPSPLSTKPDRNARASPAAAPRPGENRRIGRAAGQETRAAALGRTPATHPSGALSAKDAQAAQARKDGRRDPIPVARPKPEPLHE